jgi:uncharacterized membrane protein HdeD (DUF308 family)
MTASAFAVQKVEFPWWLVLLEGIAVLILGILLVIAPGATLEIIVQIVGFFWLIKGLFNIISIFIDQSMWGWKLFAGILGIIAGLVVLRHPLWSAVALPAIVAIIIGIQGIIVGVVGLVVAFKGGGVGPAILGVVSILFGLVLLINPILSAVALVLVLAAFAIVGGVASIIMAFRLRPAG